jgi:hypothetical protein
MKKIALTIGILVLLALFAAADFYINGLNLKIPTFKAESPAVVIADQEEIKTDSMFRIHQAIGDYKVKDQWESNQIFEKIDLSGIKNIEIFKNELVPLEGGSEPIFLYEIQGPVDQGALTYLSVKLAFIAQINAVTEVLNETGEYGLNSFYFNDENYKNTAFLLTQINDNLFGFQYKKQPLDIFEAVKGIIDILTP